MNKIDKVIEKVKRGNSVPQYMEGEYYWMLTYLADDFFLEKYHSKTNELLGVECICEETARFSLTSRY